MQEVKPYALAMFLVFLTIASAVIVAVAIPADAASEVDPAEIAYCPPAA